MLTRCLGFALAASFSVLFSCAPSTHTSAAADNTQPAKEAAEPPTPVTAKSAFWEIYTSARKNWATDFVLLKMTPKEIPAFTNEAGKAAMWEAVLASPGKQEYRVYTYAIAAYPPDVYKGVVVGRPLPFAGFTRDVMPIQTGDFNVDSDIAYTTAMQDAAAWLKKHPEKKLSAFELGNAYRFQVPVWHLAWGDKKAGYIAFVNASTGKLVKNN